MSEPRTVSELLVVGETVLADSTHLFEDHDFEDQARELLATALRITEDELQDASVPSRPLRDRYLALVARRAAGEPQPFLTGRIEFYGLDLRVKPGAFVPRPSSELTVDRAIRRLRRRRNPVVVDVAAGAGPIALAVAHEISGSHAWALDISKEALAQGRSNARRLGIDNVTFRAGDMYAPLPDTLEEGVDLITAHVPYVPKGELDDLPTEVRAYEPVYTLTDDSDDGMSLVRRAVAEGVAWLKPGGWLLLEMSDDIASKTRRLMRRAGLSDEGIASDDDGLSVVVEGRKRA